MKGVKLCHPSEVVLDWIESRRASPKGDGEVVKL